MLFQHGELPASQAFSANLAHRLEVSAPEWSARFRILEAESAAWQGLGPDVVKALAEPFPATQESNVAIRRLALLGVAHVHSDQLSEAEQDFAQAQAICSMREQSGCGELLRSQAGLAESRGDFDKAYQLYGQSLASARRFGQRWDESAALMNLGAISSRRERFDDAIDWSQAAQSIATELGARDLLLNIAGNLGWAYYRLGDSERALGLYQDAVKDAIAIGDIDSAIAWLTDEGNVYQDSHDLARAAGTYRTALALARKIRVKQDIVPSLENLAHVSVEANKPDEAESWLRELDPLLRGNANRLDALDVQFTNAGIAAARRQDAHAEALYRAVDQSPDTQAPLRIAAQHALATLFTTQGRTADADAMYRTTLATFERARDQITREASRLPFLANATRIYDDYIHFLIANGHAEEALAVADQSRARTLAQGLGIDAPASPHSTTTHPVSLSPQAIARKTNATLLFYWLGDRQSYLWAVTPSKTSLFTLPPARQITPMIERYRRVLLGSEDPVASANPDAIGLYQTLVQPAASLIANHANDASVVILCDGALSLLNFETLVVPGPSPGTGTPTAAARPHFWIEDAALISAPSLYMLASARPTVEKSRRLLLLGDPVSPSPEYPELPNAAGEIARIRQHFRPADLTVFSREQANSAAYLASQPHQFAYIHFVAHGVASRTDPLDSAIILSRTAAGENSFRLDARQILAHPLDARLVTISACYGSGARSYAGEGLVGLSWAFLRAGAHNVIGALWEASDAATPRLMDALYQGLEDGLPPSTALRRAKLAMLHSQGSFRQPFFWAPFQLYTGL